MLNDFSKWLNKDSPSNEYTVEAFTNWKKDSSADFFQRNGNTCKALKLDENAKRWETLECYWNQNENKQHQYAAKLDTKRGWVYIDDSSGVIARKMILATLLRPIWTIVARTLFHLSGAGIVTQFRKCSKKIHQLDVVRDLQSTGGEDWEERVKWLKNENFSSDGCLGKCFWGRLNKINSISGDENDQCSLLGNTLWNQCKLLYFLSIIENKKIKVSNSIKPLSEWYNNLTSDQQKQVKTELLGMKKDHQLVSVFSLEKKRQLLIDENKENLNFNIDKLEEFYRDCRNRNCIRSLLDIVRSPVYGVALTVVAASAVLFTPFHSDYAYTARDCHARLQNRLRWGFHMGAVFGDSFFPCLSPLGNLRKLEQQYRGSDEVKNGPEAMVRAQVKHFYRSKGSGNPASCNFEKLEQGDIYISSSLRKQ